MEYEYQIYKSNVLDNIGTPIILLTSKTENSADYIIEYFIFLHGNELYYQSSRTSFRENKILDSFIPEKYDKEYYLDSELSQSKLVLNQFLSEEYKKHPNKKYPILEYEKKSAGLLYSLHLRNSNSMQLQRIKNETNCKQLRDLLQAILTSPQATSSEMSKNQI